MIDVDQIMNNSHRVDIPADLDRILRMPVTPPGGDPKAAAYWTQRLSLGSYVLRDIQGAALGTIYVHKGGFFAIGVGHGKTLIALLAGEVAGASKPLILCPPALVKMMRAEALIWSERFKFTPPAVESYGILSHEVGERLLLDMRPDLIIADEAHYLRRRGATRTKRLLSYFHNVNPTAGFVALSGTITAKSLLDYSHILELSLRERVPIPTSRYELNGWAACIDPDGEPTRGDLAALAPLVEWSGQTAKPSRETIRKAYKMRLVTTPGVVSTTTTSCDASLYLVEHNPKTPAAVTRAIKHLGETWTLPNGEPIADASFFSRAFRQLSIGFFYRWEWAGQPDPEWLEARRNRDRLIGRVLRYASRPGRDSPGLVSRWGLAGGGSRALRNALELWQAIKDRANPQTVPVWIDKSRIDYVENFAKTYEEPAILWYSSRAVGDELGRRGFTVHGAGSAPPTGETCAASIHVHGKGQNLQMYGRAFVVEPPASGGRWEQLIGRHHRAGQLRDEITIDFFNFGDVMAKARADARYIEDTTDNRQKLNLATFLTPAKANNQQS